MSSSPRGNTHRTVISPVRRQKAFSEEEEEMIEKLKVGELKKSMKEEEKKKNEDLEKMKAKRDQMNNGVAEDTEKAAEMEHDWHEALKIEKNVLQILRLAGHIR